MSNGGRFTLKVVAMSANVKVGPMAATYRPVGDTCPLSCDLLGRSCYAQKGNVAIHQRRSASDTHELDIALSKGARVIRHHVSGDFFTNDVFDRAYFDYVCAWHREHPRVHGYAYTHRIQDIISAGYTASTLPSNFVLMASLNASDGPDIIAMARGAGFRYARVSATPTDALESRTKNEAVCPIQLSTRKDSPITCSTCKLCLHGRSDIVFIKH
jgi:hypothetical protein